MGSNYKKYDSNDCTNSILIGEDLGWAAGVLKMLDYLESDYIILFLEDFFLNKSVDTKKILELLNITRNNQVGCFRLVSASQLSFPPTLPINDFPGLGVIVPGDLNRVSTQVAIWKTDTLRKLLNPSFNAWQFEEIGTTLSEEMPDLFWGTYHPVILYDQCVEKGKWKPEGLRYLLRKPLSAKFLIIICFGLLGKKPINWLFKCYAHFKISKIEKHEDRTPTSASK
ncbi:hypothetical protein HY041_02125 [Candidatus Roizmanbacteria bacterium]|nr:hypothetical protein [Candidatus Roizmanbacteria bacterium]